MVHVPFDPDPAPELETVLGALDDQDCRTIINQLEEPMTANQLSESGDIPLSTTYRKLDYLVDATLLNELTELRGDGHHPTRYEIAFEDVRIGLDDDRSLWVSITRPDRSPDERLAHLWREVRTET